ncbi:MAG TPA: 50S ribosomal protein L25 [Opitutaceae bacterium]|nr:50S ribosomal protein L25 [Opitutaceae bacterium]
MKQQLKLNVAPRAQTGRSSSRRMRKANQVPAVLYGKHTKPESLSVDGPEFTRLVKAIAGSAALIELERKDKPEKALSFLQEVQRDPITDKYLHVDFREVKADEKFEIQVKLHLSGESFGVKNQSGVLETPTYTLRIRCLPKDLPPFIDVDVTALKVGETIHVGEIKAIPGVDFLDDKNQPVVSCVEPVAEIVQEVVAAATPAEGAAAAPAVGADGKPVAPAADGKAAAPAADGKAAAPAAAGDKKAAAPAAGAKPAAGAAKPAAPAKK